MYVDGMHVHRTTFERNSGVPSRGLKWGKLKIQAKNAYSVLKLFSGQGFISMEVGDPR